VDGPPGPGAVRARYATDRSVNDYPPFSAHVNDPEEAVAEFPPIAKLVYETLEYAGEMTQSQLADASLLLQRTVRHARSTLPTPG